MGKVVHLPHAVTTSAMKFSHALFPEGDDVAFEGIDDGE